MVPRRCTDFSNTCDLEDAILKLEHHIVQDVMQDYEHSQCQSWNCLVPEDCFIVSIRILATKKVLHGTNSGVAHTRSI